MKVKLRAKRAMTLLEIMIVIFLISLIGGVLGYNMKGSMEKGKAFKTQQAMNQLSDIFELELSEGDYSLEDIRDNPLEVLEKSGLAKDPKNLLKDGWNEPFVLKIKNNEIKISSKKYKTYCKKNNKAIEKAKES